MGGSFQLPPFCYLFFNYHLVYLVAQMHTVAIVAIIEIMNMAMLALLDALMGENPIDPTPTQIPSVAIPFPMYSIQSPFYFRPRRPWLS